MIFFVSFNITNNSLVAAKLVESITETATTTAELLTRTGMIREEVDSAVQIIQNAFRKHLSVKLAAKPNGTVIKSNLSVCFHIFFARSCKTLIKVHTFEQNLLIIHCFLYN